jgi:CubicO group peptidase (beta-lactamase class C family)
MRRAGEEGWEAAAPEAAGLRAERLEALGPYLDGVAGANIHAVLVARHGRLVFEQYRRGPDRRWAEALPEAAHGLDTAHDLRSVTKSIVGLLFGVALERGLVPGLDTPVLDLLPEYADLRTGGRDRIRLRHLLTMTSGLDWDENRPMGDPAHGEMRMWRSPDRLRTALQPALVEEPGEVWNYAGGSTELLGAVLARGAGMALDLFAERALFAPLGIRGAEWARFADGAPSASGGLRLRARDLLSIGQLVLDGGRRGEAQLVPQAWIAESLLPRIGAADRLFFYGHHWWLGRSLVAGREVAWAAGIGLGGQRLFVVPGLDLAAVVTAGHYDDAMQSWLPLVILNRFVLGAARMAS